MLPMVYYFPLLWRAQPICQETLVLGNVTDSSFYQIKMMNRPSLITDFRGRILCEEDCFPENYNGFLNWVDDREMCSDPSRTFYHCPCHGAARWACAVDTYRLTEGTYGFVETFAYLREFDAYVWLPVCVADVYATSSIYRAMPETDQRKLATSNNTFQLQMVEKLMQVERVATVICRSLGFEFEPVYGFTLPSNPKYKTTAWYLPFTIDCAGTEPHLRNCSLVHSHDRHCAKGASLHIRCTADRREPNPLKFSTLAPQNVSSLASQNDSTPASQNDSTLASQNDSALGPQNDFTLASAFEILEPEYGRWVPVSELGWSPAVNDMACQSADRLDVFGAHRVYSCLQHYEYYTTRGIQPETGHYQMMVDGANYPVLCDMTKTDPGWMLLFNNTMNWWWSNDDARLFNAYSYSPHRSYSVLGLADHVTKRFPGSKFDVRIDVDGKGVFSAGGGIFRIPGSESLVGDSVSTNIEILQISDTFVEDPASGFYLQVPHFSNWTEGHAIYTMQDNRRGSGPYGNLIARNPALTNINFWTPGPLHPPSYISMWLREVNEDDSEGKCTDSLYIFAQREFSKRQLYGSPGRVGHEAWESTFRGQGWIPLPIPPPPQQWIQVDLIVPHLISRIIISGTVRSLTFRQPNSTEEFTQLDSYYIRTFRLLYKRSWKDTFRTVDIVFRTNATDGATRVVLELKRPLRGRIFRIVPIDTAMNKTEPIGGVKWELYGCRLQLHPLSAYVMGDDHTHLYRVAGKSKYGRTFSGLLTESEYFAHRSCDFTSVEVDLHQYNHVDGLVFAGNQYRSATVTGIKVYYSADGSREMLKHNMQHVNGTVIPVRETTFSMNSENELVYADHPIISPDARLLRLQFDRSCPFRFEILGRRIVDHCELPLNVSSDKFIVTTSSQKDRTAEFGIDKTKLQGFSVWFPEPNDSKKSLTIDFVMIYSIAAIGVRGMGQDWLSSFQLSYALATNKWILYRQFEVTENPTEMLILHLNPPIDQARFIRIHQVSIKRQGALRLELFGCAIPPLKSPKFPGVNVLHKTALVYAENVTIPPSESKSMRACYTDMLDKNNGAFIYDEQFGHCREARALDHPSVLGFQRNQSYDLLWPDNETKPDWGPRPLVSHVKCPGAETHFSECKRPHIQDDPEHPSSPVIPNCVISCGNPGEISCARRFGNNFLFVGEPNVTVPSVAYQCLYDYLNPAPEWLNMECHLNGTWTPRAPECPRFANKDLTKDRPLWLSSFDTAFTALAMAWPIGKDWTKASMRCKSTKKTTYPYVVVDMLTANDVHGMDIDFGIMEDLPNANLNIHVTNTLEPKYAMNDICHSQMHARSHHRRWLNITCQYPVVGRYIIIQIRESEPIHLVVCAIRVNGTSCAPYGNLALEHGSVAESGIAASAAQASYLAIDGHAVLPLGDDPTRPGTCYSTADRPGFLTIDLGSQVAVHGVTVYGAGSGSELNISVSPVIPGYAKSWSQNCWDGSNATLPNNATDDRLAVACTSGLVFGRYVTVSKINQGAGLTICELKVWGRNCSERVNRALYKPVQFSSEGESGVSPSYAVDDDPRTAFTTDPEGNPYLVVDLIGTYALTSIEIMNGRFPLTNLNISTSSTGYMWDNFSIAAPVVSSVQADETVTMQLYARASLARYVWVEIYNTSSRNVPVEIREIRAISMGCSENPVELVTYRNLVLGIRNVTAAHSVNELADPFVTVDGMKVPRRNMCYEIFGTDVVIWKAVLPHNVTVSRISVYGIFPLSLKAYVNATLCGSISSPDAKLREFSTVCDHGAPETPIGLLGSIVTIQKSSSDLINVDATAVTLCEVEVWGTT